MSTALHRVGDVSGSFSAAGEWTSSTVAISANDAIKGTSPADIVLSTQNHANDSLSLASQGALVFGGAKALHDTILRYVQL